MIFSIIPCCKSSNPSEKDLMFDRSTTMLADDLDLLRMVQTLHKVKACLEIMLTTQDKVELAEIREAYFKNTNLYPTERLDNQFRAFLSRDEKKHMNTTTGELVRSETSRSHKGGAAYDDNDLNDLNGTTKDHIKFKAEGGAAELHSANKIMSFINGDSSEKEMVAI